MFGFFKRLSQKISLAGADDHLKGMRDFMHYVDALKKDLQIPYTLSATNQSFQIIDMYLKRFDMHLDLVKILKSKKTAEYSSTSL